MISGHAARRLCLAGYAAAAALRLFLLFRYPGGYDTQSYAIVAGIEARRGNVYAETPRYNYSPVWGWLLLVFEEFGRVTTLGLVPITGLFLLTIDAATAAVVARLASIRAGPARGRLAGLLFFANPVSILVSSWHLQFDGLSILFLLLAIHSAGEDASPRAATLGWLSASLLAKHITWFHPLLLARRTGGRRMAWYLVPYALFLLSFLPYRGAWQGIRDHVFRYRSVAGNYGTEAMLLIPGVPEWLPTALFGLAALGAAWLLVRGELFRAALRLFLVLLVFLPGFGRQYCVWPIALGSIAPGSGLLVYTLVAAGFLARGMFGFDQAPAWLPGWYGPAWAALLWLLLEFRRVASEGPEAGGSGLRSDHMGKLRLGPGRADGSEAPARFEAYP